MTTKVIPVVNCILKTVLVVKFYKEKVDDDSFCFVCLFVFVRFPVQANAAARQC